MSGLRLWLRRGTGAPLAVLICAFVLISLLTQPQWRLELDWATRLSASSVLLTTPFVAAAAAFDTGHRLRSTLARLGLGSPRLRLHVLAPAVAVAVWVVTAYVVAWVVAAAIVTAHHGVGVTDWWVFGEISAPLVAAAFVGSLLALVLPEAVSAVLGAPLAAVTVLAGTVLASPWGRGPFEAVTTFGTLTGLERPVVRAVTVIGADVVLAAAAAAAVAAAYRPERARRVLFGGCAVVMLAATVLPAAWPWTRDVYTVSTEAVACVGTAPAVCGPASRARLLVPVQASLAAAYTTLAGTDFAGPSTYTVTRLDHYADLHGAAPLDFDPALLHEGPGHDGLEDPRSDVYAQPGVVAALLRPHQCRELFNAEQALAILNAQDRVRPWLQAVLEERTAARPVPTAVQTAFTVIESCDVMTTDR